MEAMRDGSDGSLPLGVAGTTEYRSYTATLEPDSVVVFYTDGITEFSRQIEIVDSMVA